ncbi:MULTISPECIES: contact-dependent growth inhibition system immunity protein [unclassified Streptomyces]|uniref:contact-dependent growth inhibition system immunity protein n=1 Tax=unclassified Streptomyces TaxID=2593676 RepID=UPI002DDC3692|nr:contact-dependent growth inhibition system immunity protein [Streptomyces sp. NBC_01750]WSB00858.1 contact-dependent growth inhibition system immunity protein [Streptomyces sp. NBC_01794]WSD34787.1 contact-dependent growth inhibition system immunity protein [Streptomyces sp. NBC_01750]
MSLKPLEHDRKYGELDQVIRAYLGQPADDDPEKRSAALDAYLRHTWRTRPWAIAVAEHQLREYANNPPGRLRLRLGEFYPVPDVGLPDSATQAWLKQLADHLKHSVETGEAPPPATPQTHWEWHARFPELGQLLGGWFSQDMPDEFESHDAALQDYLDTTDSGLIAQLTGELHELLALPLNESDYVLAVAELGMEVDPPYAPRVWLTEVAGRLG